ncbi:hypothetical protein D3C80_768510 [compost metagenome]
MAITNYTELQAAISDYMARNDVSGKATEFIALAEARLNRQIDSIASTITLNGVANQNYIDITAMNIIEPISLYVDGVIHEFSITPKPQGSFPYFDIAATPSQWCIEEVIDGANRYSYIRFDRALDVPYTFRFTYQGRFALSDAVPTNEFLTNYPDVYLAASIVWGCLYTKALKDGAMWKTVLEEGLEEAKSTYAQSKRGVLTVDPMLRRRTAYSFNLDTAV